MPERRAARRADAGKGAARVPKPDRAGATGRTIRRDKTGARDPAESRPSNFERGAADADIRITNRDAFGGAEDAGDTEEESAR